jgi:hypothetical protein
VKKAPVRKAVHRKAPAPRSAKPAARGKVMAPRAPAVAA